MNMNIETKTMDIINRVGKTPDKLLEILIETQRNSEGNYITENELRIISKALGVPLSKVYGVATFYSMLSTKKRGKYIIQVCKSGPCYVNGTSTVVDVFENVLGIKMGEVTNDGLFSLEYTSCLGACDIAPAVKINEQLYGNLTVGKIIEIVDVLKRGGIQ